MNNRTILIAALALGLVAAVINWVYMSSVQASGLTVLRVKAGKTIQVGQPVTRDMFDAVTIYGDVGQLRKLAVPESDLASFKDQPVVEVLEPGDLLLQRAFQFKGDTGIRELIGPGERALSVTVADEARAVGYFVRPGDVVDVWGSINNQTLLLKDHARVGAVGDAYLLPSDAGSKTKGFRTVTLIVSAKDIEGLVNNIGLASGKVTLSLIGPEDAKAPSGPALEPVTTLKPSTTTVTGGGATPKKPEPAAPSTAPPAATAPAPAPQNTNR